MIKKFILSINLILICTIFIGCGKKYSIEYNLNGGIMPEEYETEFRVKDEYRLPTPTKEGFMFLGWKQNDIYIDFLENKNYELTAEWIEIIDYTIIEDNQIFEQEQEDYLVYFMKTSCPWCNKIKEDILRYQYKINNVDQYYKNIKIYIVNLEDAGKKSTIFRKYDGEEGNEGFLVEGVNTWDELYIPSVPTLIKVSTQNNLRSAILLESSASKVQNRIYEFLVDKNDYSSIMQPFKIVYNLDGGLFDEMVNNIFYSANTLTLPIPVKDQYTFIGWYENGVLVDKNNIKNKDYNVTAKWQKTIETLYINKEEIFHKDGKYYVLFLKNVKNIMDFVKTIDHYNTLAEINGNPLIYIIDMNDCNEIYRTYSEEVKYYVDEAKEWNEFFISDRYTLIKMSGKTESKEATFITSSKKNVLDYLNEKYNFLIK